MASKQRLDLSPATYGFAAMAALNMAASAALVFGFGSAQVEIEREAFQADLVKKASAEAARMGAGLLPHVADAAKLAAEARRLAPNGARYELTGNPGGKWRVLASTDASSVGKPPSGVGGGEAAPVGRFERDGADLRYTTILRLTVPAAPAPKPAQARPTPPPAPRPVVAATHRVKPGETLFKISRQHFGTDGQFEAIYRLNREVIGPDRSNLPTGAVLTLPRATPEGEPAAAATPTPKPTPTPPARPRELALVLSLGEPAPAESDWLRPAFKLAAGAAGLSGVLWLLGGWMLASKRRKRLEQQRLRLLGGLDARMRPRGPLFDPASLHSPWQIEHAGMILASAEPGGSFAEIQALSDSTLALFVGDATGSAVNAVVSRGLAVATWRARAGAGAGPGETLSALNRLMADFVPQGDHVTAFYAQLDLHSGALRYASASHAGACVLSEDGRVTVLGGRGLPMGIGQELFQSRLQAGEHRLGSGETLWIFTDGLLKAENAQGEPFGLQRLEACLATGAGLAPEGQIAHVKAAVLAFAGKRALGDDAALACVRLAALPAVTAPTTA